MNIIEIKKDDKNYPKQLLKIKNPPKQIYAQGNLNLLNKAIVGIVGSRDCTIYGYNQSQKIAGQLSKNNICIIGGLAIRN